MDGKYGMGTNKETKKGDGMVAEGNSDRLWSSK
jgi:hypothetical protein